MNNTDCAAVESTLAIGTHVGLNEKEKEKKKWVVYFFLTIRTATTIISAIKTTETA
jgi:hypothetical protein